MKDMAGERPFRMAVKDIDSNQVHVRMFDIIPPEGEVEVMQITAKRVR